MNGRLICRLMMRRLRLLLVAFAEFDESNNETERARCIYNYMMDRRRKL